MSEAIAGGRSRMSLRSLRATCAPVADLRVYMMVYTNGIYHRRAAHDCHRKTLHARPQPGRAAAEGISLRGKRGAGQQGRRQGDPGAVEKTAVRCGGVVRASG